MYILYKYIQGVARVTLQYRKHVKHRVPSDCVCMYIHCDFPYLMTVYLIAIYVKCNSSVSYFRDNREDMRTVLSLTRSLTDMCGNHGCLGAMCNYCGTVLGVIGISVAGISF
jgi:hypothetical protein